MDILNSPSPTIEIEQYISDKEEEIKDFINYRRKVLINSSPGSGKTTFIANLCISQVQNEIPGRIIFCSPFLIIQSQFKTALKEAGVAVDFELNGNSRRKHLVPSDKIITSTYHSFHKISDSLVPEDLVVVDEAHSLLFTYNKGSKRTFFTKTVNALYSTRAKIVLMTGTPYSGITSILELSELKIIKNNVQSRINVQYVKEKDTATAMDFAKYCLKIYGPRKLNIIYYKNTSRCERIRDVIERNLGVRCHVLTADKKDSDLYQELELNSLIPEDITFLITTNVISTGANILNDNIGRALMLNEFNPTEIKQFSKRFRKKMDIEVDVINPIRRLQDINHSEARKTLILEREQQRRFFKETLLEIEKNHLLFRENLEFDEPYFPDTHVGSPNHVISLFIKRMVIQEAFYAEKIADTYNTADELKEALCRYSDVMSIVVDFYASSYTSRDHGEETLELLEKLRFQFIIIDFITDQQSYLKSLYAFFKRKNNRRKIMDIERYLAGDIEINEIKPQDIDKEKIKVFETTNFIQQIFMPLIKVDEFFKDRGKALHFIMNEAENKRSPFLIALYVNDLIKGYLQFVPDENHVLPPEIRVSPLANRHLINHDSTLRPVLTLIIKSYDYLVYQKYINLSLFKKYLLEKCQIEFPKDEENPILSKLKVDPKTFILKDIQQSLIIGLAHGIFYLNNNARKITHPTTKKRILITEFMLKLPDPNDSVNEYQKKERVEIQEETEVWEFEMPLKMFGLMDLNSAVRIINNRKLILHSIVNDRYFQLLDE